MSEKKPLIEVRNLHSLFGNKVCFHRQSKDGKANLLVRHFLWIDSNP